MGNQQSMTNRMAAAAMSNVLKLTKTQLLELRDASLVYASTGSADPSSDGPSSPMIYRSDFIIAMNEVGISAETDVDVLDKLFTMADRTGEDCVELMPFLVGLSPLASLKDVRTKLSFALELFDVDRTGYLSYDDLLDLLMAINATASYFGDTVLTPQQIDDIVGDIFESTGSQRIAYSEHINEMVSHPLVETFAQGEGSARYSPGD
mmetsp:Transcript_4711/g.9156  ORF Transcript_4711/g.9156 Transcript_4711/m.9156 type:complete len:207 (-) Transcript_4711:167-787(-)|eukprot:CAMPEP_0178584880 /NCGR_PEP_ID=MMETSP0697-20121206/25084_1 /TAXON_ID=265572 /ORGANISM="Extubocellulus spinifer, Strain CCMP396" /LENGTH=206 /DNA_ID=CAMNT_0020220889 /DNA_START=174 /DNA_END=794 /DNA_ORIENTATION=+